MPISAGEAVATLLIVDLVDSTRWIEALGDVRAAAVGGRHDRLARALLRTWRGREIDKTDGFLILFERASDAVGFAGAWHQALAELSAELGCGLSARVGIHTGAVLLRANPEDEVRAGAKPLEVEGLAKPIAARIAGLASAGRTLLSADTAGALGAEGPALRCRGHWMLKGLSQPIEVFEATLPGQPEPPVPEDGPKAWRVTDAGGIWKPVREVPNNLPREVDTFVGRDSELAELARRFDEGAALVTLLGPGGTGKTRLARQLGLRTLGEWPGGVWFADLSEATTTDDACAVLGRLLGAPPGSRSARDAVSAAVAARGRALFVMDNFEQLPPDAAAALTEWLTAAPEAHFLVTSRSVLHVRGEQVVPLEPLACAGVGGPAVALFLARARAARPGFDPDAATLAAIASLVQELDGLPLAIELVAARMRTLTPARLLERLGRRFEVVAGPTGVRPDRQATLRGAIDWSWNLLTPWEQAAFAQLAAFRGGFDLDAAEAVLDLSAWPEAGWTAEVLQALVDRSLVTSDGADEPRFSLLVSLQEYAAERLRATGGDARVFQRHGTWYADRYPMLETELRARGGTKPMPPPRELDNVAAALERALTARDVDLAARIGYAALYAQQTHGTLSAAEAVAVRLLAVPDLPVGVRALVLAELAYTTRLSGRPAEGLPLAEQAVLLARVGGGRPLVRALHHLANMHWAAKRYDATIACCEEMIAVATSIGDDQGVAFGHGTIGHTYTARGDPERAIPALTNALRIVRARGDTHGEGQFCSTLAYLEQRRGRYDEAQQHLRHALDLFRSMANFRYEFISLGNLGELELHVGTPHRAADLAAEAIAGVARLGDARAEFDFRRLRVTALLRLGRTADALREAEALPGLGRKLDRVAFADALVAEALACAGEPERAMARLNSASPTFLGTLVRAEVLLWTGAPDECLAVAATLPAPDSRESRLRAEITVASARVAAGCPEAGLDALDAADHLLPADQPAAWIIGVGWRSRALRALGRPEEAAAALSASQPVHAAAGPLAVAEMWLVSGDPAGPLRARAALPDLSSTRLRGR